MYVLVVDDDQHVLRLHAVRYLPRTNDGIGDPGSLRGPRNIGDWIGSDGGESDRGISAARLGLRSAFNRCADAPQGLQFSGTGVGMATAHHRDGTY